MDKIINYLNKILLLSLIIFSFTATLASADYIELSPIKDTFVYSLPPYDNVSLGTSGTISLHENICWPLNWQIAYLQYNISNIPTNSVIVNASLFVPVSTRYAIWGTTLGRLEFHEVFQDWNEYTMTWYTQPSFNITPFSSVVEDVTSVQTCYQDRYYYDFSDLVKKHFTTDKIVNIRIALRAHNGCWVAYYFPSKEMNEATKNHFENFCGPIAWNSYPRLIVSYYPKYLPITYLSEDKPLILEFKKFDRNFDKVFQTTNITQYNQKIKVHIDCRTCGTKSNYQIVQYWTNETDCNWLEETLDALNYWKYSVHMITLDRNVCNISTIVTSIFPDLVLKGNVKSFEDRNRFVYLNRTKT